MKKMKFHCSVKVQKNPKIVDLMGLTGLGHKKNPENVYVNILVCGEKREEGKDGKF